MIAGRTQAEGPSGLMLALKSAMSCQSQPWRCATAKTLPPWAVVITIIESLRAFDIVYIINGGRNGLELISALVIQNLVGEGQVIGIGSALAVILLVVSLVPIVIYLSRTFKKEV